MKLMVPRKRKLKMVRRNCRISRKNLSLSYFLSLSPLFFVVGSELGVVGETLELEENERWKLKRYLIM